MIAQHEEVHKGGKSSNAIIELQGHQELLREGGGGMQWTALYFTTTGGTNRGGSPLCCCENVSC